MIPGITPIERAFELAKSGRCRTMVEIVARLKAEGYPTDQIDSCQTCSPFVGRNHKQLGRGSVAVLVGGRQ